MLLDKFIHPTLQNDFDTLYRARVLSAILIIYIAIITVVNIWLIYSDSISAAGKPYALIICFSMAFVYLGSIFLLRSRGFFSLTAQSTIVMTTLGIAGGTLISGGPLNAPAISMNILPIIMAFVLINKRAGVLWTLVILSIHIFLVILHNNGFHFPQMLAKNTLPIQHLLHWLVIYSAMLGLMFVYNTLNSRLKKERDNERKKFKHLASHDPLTSLANRLQFDENLMQSLDRSDRHNKITALFFIDLDGFKPINDTYGHETGDLVLKEIAYRLKHNLRNMDTIARLGGDEFGIILEDITDTEDLSDIAEKLLQVISEPVEFLTDKPFVSCSIGISLYPTHTRNKMQLLKYADSAMYAAKKNKNHWQMFDPDCTELNISIPSPSSPQLIHS